MPLDRRNCDECGTNHQVCPECGEPTVSVDSHQRDEYPPGQSHLSPDFSEFGRYSETGEEIHYSLVCWNCEFREDRKLVAEEL